MKRYVAKSVNSVTVSVTKREGGRLAENVTKRDGGVSKILEVAWRSFWMAPNRLVQQKLFQVLKKFRDRIGISQLIRLNNERFSIPELLFSPSDVAVKEMGISEAIVHCIQQCPEETRPHLYRYVTPHCIIIGTEVFYPIVSEIYCRFVRYHHISMKNARFSLYST